MKKSGFTLIEVLVALLVLSVVLSGTYVSINNFSQQKRMLQQRWTAHSIGWNKLMAVYQRNRGWNAPEDSTTQSRGNEKSQGRKWQWEILVEPTLGQDMFRYEVEVADPEGKVHSNLVMFMVQP
ncbi:MAG: type II secretion system minor pseudopilin GspI [Pseudomonadales bacterium]